MESLFIIMLLETSLAAFEQIKNFQKKPFTKIFDKHFCVYIKMSIFPNVLLAFNFFKIAQPTRKAYRGRRHPLEIYQRCLWVPRDAQCGSFG